MNPCYKSLSLFIFFLLFSSLPSALAETGTSIDSKNNIQFIFNDVASIKIAPSSTAAAGSACATPLDIKTGKPVYEGAMRFNDTLNDIEFCNGTVWAGMSQPYPTGYAVSVDYSNCTAAIASHNNKNLYSYYKAFGSPDDFQINLACPKDYVMVASDASARTNTDTYTDAFCCKLTVK